MILSSKHYFDHVNPGKQNVLKQFISEYRRVAQLYVDYLWEYGIHLTISKEGKTKNFFFDARTRLDCPNMLCNPVDFSTTLTARAKSCCLTQVLGIIKGNVAKQRKRYFVANQKRAQHKKVPRKLRKAVRRFRPVKPDVSCINPEIASMCLDFRNDNRRFDGWLRLKSFTSEKYNFSVNLPISFHKHSRKLEKNGTLLTSFLLTEKYVALRWEQKTVPNTGVGTVGADQGKNTILALSDGQNTPEKDKHGHSLDSILGRLERRKKGSKSFRRAQEHRTNFINWSINQLNLSNIKQLNFENVKYLTYKNPTNRKMSHWTYTEIRDQVEKRCALEEVLIRYDSSTYYSQRCHQCSLVLQSNRKGKVYSCKNCGYEGDADYNSSCNHQQDLPDLSDLRKLKLNVKGFFWKPEGIYSLDGEELTVPLSKQNS